MADKTSLAASFDELLSQNKQAFDALMGRSGATPPASPPRQTTQRSASEKQPNVTKETDSEKWLNRHYGNRWRLETSHRRVENGEVTILCRLTLIDENIRRAQFGRASLRQSHGAATSSASGTVDGIAFSLQGTTASGNPSSDTEAAIEAAIEDGLKNCIASL